MTDRKLPTRTVHPESPSEEASPAERDGSGVGDSVRAESADPPALRLLTTLAVAGALAGLLLVAVHGWTEPRIEAHRARVLNEAIEEVLGGPDRYETMYVVDGSLTAVPPVASDSSALDRIYVGYDRSNRTMGLAIAGAQPGFQDVVRLIFGFDPEAQRVMGMKVLENKETPGLGDKIEKDSAFVAEFAGVDVPLEGVKASRATGAAHEVDMITGATISSRTVIEIINGRLEELDGVLSTYAVTATAAAGGGS